MAQTQPPVLDPLPQAPNQSQPTGFATIMDAFLAALVIFRTQLVAFGSNVYNNAVDAFNNATAAAGSAATASGHAAAAATSATSAAGSVTAAAAVLGAAPWASGTTYQQFACAVSKVNFKVYRKSTTAAASTGGVVDPANDPTNWQVQGALTTPRSQRTANAILTAKDLGLLVDITSGTFTQTFDTANLNPDWWCWIRNGTGEVTIPSSDGVANWVMYPGEVRFFQWDGATMRTFVIQSFYKVFTSSGNFIKPPGYQRFDGEMWGGGCSGGKYSSASVLVYGGGGGAYLPFSFVASALAASSPVVVGSGGAQVPDGFQYGAVGGSSSFGGLTAYGGASQYGGQPFTNSSGANSSHVIGQGTTGAANSYPPTLYGGASATMNTNAPSGTVYGGGAGGTIDSSNNICPVGPTLLGGPGGVASLTAAGNGVVPGGGGGATRSGPATVGARGEVRVWGVV